MKEPGADSFGATSILDAITEVVPDLQSTAAEEIDRVPERPEHGHLRYQALGLIGKGGLGEVIEARDHDLLRTVAVKRPRKGRKSSSAMARLVLEAQVTAQLAHPNVPPVHELGVGEDGVPFFVMAKIDGRSLQALLEARKTDPEVRALLTVPRILRIVLHVGYALAYAHDRGVIHRDVKPENVLIGPFGQVYLMDWGIAKVRGRSETAVEAPQNPPPVEALDFQTRGAGFLGSVAYAAPEQLRGAEDMDGRVDVYSLAALLYTMLAGRPPVVGDSVQSTAAAAILGDVPPLASLCPVPEQLAAIVHRGLEPDRERRYPSIEALLDEIEAMLEGRPVSVLHENAIKQFKRWYFGRPRWLFRFRTIDLDLIIGTWTFLGFAVGVWLGHWQEGMSNILAWALLVVGLVMSIRPTYTMLRKPHPDDPDSLHVFGDVAPVAPVSTAASGAPEETTRRTPSQGSRDGSVSTKDE